MSDRWSLCTGCMAVYPYKREEFEHDAFDFEPRLCVGGIVTVMPESEADALLSECEKALEGLERTMKEAPFRCYCSEMSTQTHAADCPWTTTAALLAKLKARGGKGV